MPESLAGAGAFPRPALTSRCTRACDDDDDDHDVGHYVDHDVDEGNGHCEPSYNLKFRHETCDLFNKHHVLHK